MLKKVSRSKDAVVDVRADDPAHAMERFTDGLRRVLAVPKNRIQKKRTKRRRA